MSLTNDMLNNLDKRRTAKSGSSLLLNSLESTTSNPSYYLTYGFYLLSVIALIGLVVGLFYANLHQLKPQARPVIMKAPLPPKMSRLPGTLTATSAAISLPLSNTIAISASPNNVSADALLKTPVQEPMQDRMNQLYQDALNLIAQNQRPAAIQQLQLLTQQFPTFQEARVTLATVYLENNDSVRATTLLNNGLMLAPKDVSLTLLYARALLMENHATEALQTITTIADTAGDNSTYVDLLASIQQALGHYSDAIPLYQALLAQDPSNSRWLVSLAVSFEKDGQNDAALSAYKKADTAGQLPANLQSYVAQHIRDLGG